MFNGWHFTVLLILSFSFCSPGTQSISAQESGVAETGVAETRVNKTQLDQDDVIFVKDIFYRDGESKLDEYQKERCYLDWYLPKGKSNFPTMVWFHGGGLRNGQKDGAHDREIAIRFARDGITVTSVNYRLNPTVKFPAYVEDAAAAVGFVMGSIESKGGNKEQVFVSGHSAGGYLTLMLALNPEYLSKVHLNPTDVAGYLPISGQTITHSTVRSEKGIDENQPWIDDAAPAFYVATESAPILCIAGSEDLPARSEENRYLVAMLKAAGNNATFVQVEGRNHSTIAHLIPQPNDVVAEQMINFIREITSQKPAQK